MHEMIKGSNVALSALSEDSGSVVVSLSWSSAAGDGDADVSVLLLDSDGKVRSDADFFFYNNPAAEDGSVQLLGKTPTDNGSEDRIGLAKRLIRQLADAPADLHIETLTEIQGSGPRGTLERLRPEPADLLPKGDASVTGFRLSLIKGMGSTRGKAESGFIRSVDEAIDRFYAGVITALDRPPAKRSQGASKA